ncbi:Rz-like spanin [Aquamicrobium phage P14]|uniref:Uncharacterized protein n=1 Tax=Aquamicrobium phage P14 TaxID=1927013 RepID=A0A1L5C044_9CAUD|nr:Rz-like spanin [Aquamicrobium phage P14]APL99460.1 hypothetical protein BB738_0020 [Aquamicrobium phage P14]
MQESRKEVASLTDARKRDQEVHTKLHQELARIREQSRRATKSLNEALNKEKEHADIIVPDAIADALRMR